MTNYSNSVGNGKTKPWVTDAAHEIAPAFSVPTVFGLGERSTPGSDHPKGLALDFMVYGDRTKGESVAAYVLANAKRLGVTYLIWWQRINSVDGQGWEPMEDRGSTTANHKDHVHVSFSTNGSGKGAVVTTAGLQNPLDPDTYTQGFQDFADAFSGLGTALGWLADTHNWLRIAEVLGGVVLLLMAVFTWDTIKDTVSKAASKTKTRVGVQGA